MQMDFCYKGHFWQQQETLQETANSVQVPKTSRQMTRPINFMKPDSGSRLDIFDPTDNTVEVVPPGRPNLTEVSRILLVCITSIIVYAVTLFTCQ